MNSVKKHALLLVHAKAALSFVEGRFLLLEFRILDACGASPNRSDKSDKNDCSNKSYNEAVDIEAVNSLASKETKEPTSENCANDADNNV
jgi:hypothetical protein